MEHSELNLTAGAQRALAALRDSSQHSSRELFRTLVGFLLESEGNATELLREARVELWPIHRSPDDLDESFQYLEWQRELVRNAQRIALQTNAQGLAGSEHLLLAAVEMDRETAQELERFGLTHDVILNRITLPDPDLSVSGAGQLIQIRPAEPGNLDQAGLYRILDASANRAREGLRVIEDYVRFRRDNGIISRELKEVRHHLTKALNDLNQHRWVAARDSVRDVGALGKLASERHRGSLEDVVRANLKRVEESLRSLEEYTKLLDQELSLTISRCRYRMYTVEKSLEALFQGRQRLEQATLYLLVTASQCRYGAEATIRHAIEKGIDVIQIREKEKEGGDLLGYAEQVREWTAASGTLLIVNDRVDIAAAVGADGVHLGQDDLSVAAARKILGGSGLIGVSTHNLQQARQALFDGADYLGVGPVFPSKTKEFTDFAGLDYVRQAADNISIPWFAIGGIQAENLKEVLAAGARRIAVSSTICRAPDPRGVTETLKEILRNANSAGTLDRSPVETDD